jgi:menaquinol-cytochrome c reductase iron-sulfur subunit
MAEKVTRRGALMSLGIALNAVAAALVGVPIIGYLLGPARGKRSEDLPWIVLGPVTGFPEGETRLATFRNPGARAWDGETANIPCYVRRLHGNRFQVFAINCAHLGCPVRWFPQSGLFLCPCHGGVYYEDGSRASGPPPRDLFQYPYKIENDQLVIQAGKLPTLAWQSARLRKDGSPPCV